MKALVLLSCAIALLSLAGFVFVGGPLAAPVAIAGAGSLILALA